MKVLSFCILAMIPLVVHCLEISDGGYSAVTSIAPSAQTELENETCLDSVESAKLATDFADGKTCNQYADTDRTDSGTVESAKTQPTGKQITVSSLVSLALADQRQLLLARQADLERWNEADQKHFRKWFGTTSDEAREQIYERIRILTLLNKEYAVGNFRRVVPSRPGLFAFVKPADPSRIFVDKAFVLAPLTGENSRPGTLTHEMSHFVLAGGTKDIAYGIANCKFLARKNPALALANADSFEFFVENLR